MATMSNTDLGSSSADVILDTAGTSSKSEVPSTGCNDPLLKLLDRVKAPIERYGTMSSNKTVFGRKRLDLSLAQKVAVLTEMESTGATQTVVGNKYGISKSQVSRIVKAKRKIFENYRNNRYSHERKRMRLGKDIEVDKALRAWYNDRRRLGEQLTGQDLKRKANELAAALGTGFIASNGWFYRWKFRNNVSLNVESPAAGVGSDGAAAAAEAVIRDWHKDILPEIVQTFTEGDIFSAREIPLLYRAFPDTDDFMKGFDFGSNGTLKDRITALLCVNMNGSEKLPLVVTGAYAHPASFPLDWTCVPIMYKSTPKASISKDVFKEWLTKLDDSLRSQNRKICLIVDNKFSYIYRKKLVNIKLKFLSSPTVHPLDSLVAKNWKGHYRSRLFARMMPFLEAGPGKVSHDIAKGISVLDALFLAKEAWEAVSALTIIRSFSRAGFGYANPSHQLCGYKPPEDEDDALADVGFPEHMSPEVFYAFVTMEEFVEVRMKMSGGGGKLLVFKNGMKHSPASTEENEPPRLTLAEKLQMVDYMRRFIQENAMTSAGTLYREIQDMVYTEVSRTKTPVSLHSYYVSNSHT